MNPQADPGLGPGAGRRRHPSIADRLPLLRRRAQLARAVRAFFDARGYLEVETPYAVATPGEEVHLLPFRTERIATDGSRERLFLHTSPEFAMKRLVAATGLPVFQLARVWRNGEGGALHAAEFTMLEWYRPGADLASLMDETEALLRATLPPRLSRDGRDCVIDAPFERLRLQHAFARELGADLLASDGDAALLAAQAGVARRAGEGWEDLFFRLRGPRPRGGALAARRGAARRARRTAALRRRGTRLRPSGAARQRRRPAVRHPLARRVRRRREIANPSSATAP